MKQTMGFFDEIRKVLFGVKSVSKSAADKVVDKGREAAEKSGEYMHRAKDKVEDFTEDIADKAENIWDKAIDGAEEFGKKVKSTAGDFIDDAKDFAEDVGEKVIHKADDLFDDAKELAEDVGEKVIKTADKAASKAKDLGGAMAEKVRDYTDAKKTDDDLSRTSTEKSAGFDEDIFDKIKDKSEDAFDDLKSAASTLGHKASEVKSDLVDKAKDWSQKLSDKLDETVHKAENLARHEAAQPEYKKPSEHLHKSELGADKDDFFKKAEAFADGRYDEVRDPFSDKPKIVGKTEKPKPATDATSPVPGFEDMDGDGDEIIDDAVIDSEE